MKRTEIILITIALIAVVMQFMHFPGGNILFIISLLLLSGVYLYFGFALFNSIKFGTILKKTSYEFISTTRIIGGIGTGVALSISGIGILFKSLSWPGATLQLGVGIFLLLIISIIASIKLGSSNDDYFSKILKRTVLFTIISVFLVSISTKTWLNWKYPNHPDYVNAVLNAQEDSDNSELWGKVDVERTKMNVKNK